jgi:hypothetical protein
MVQKLKLEQIMTRNSSVFFIIKSEDSSRQSWQRLQITQAGNSN